MSKPGLVTQYLERHRDGDDEALNKILPLLYDELRQLARLQLYRQGSPTESINPTTLVNELYLKLVKQNELKIGDRTHFFAVASHTMRHILVDYARAKKRIKRGGGATVLNLEDSEHLLTETEAEEVIALDEALNRLAKINPRGSTIVQYRFYTGLTIEETADVMQMSSKTVQRSWISARAWLKKEMENEES